MKLKQKILRWLENHRSIIIVTLVLPLSLLFRLFVQSQKFLNRSLRTILYPSTHEQRVRYVQRQVSKWRDSPPDERKMMCTARPNWQSLSTTFFRKDLCHQISIPLYEILNLDEEKLTVTVEPLVTVGEITKYLVTRGYTLAVCLEVAEATLGGLAMGVGMTTHSHKVGLFQETVLRYEMVLGDGSVVNVTKNSQYEDLFFTLPWSHGTLGFLVSLELQIIKIKPFLKLEYIPVKGQNNYCEMMRKYSGALDKNYPVPDYLEATVYSKNEAVIMVGNFCDLPHNEAHKVNKVSSWYKPWFYMHVEKFLKKGQAYEYIPLDDYLLRHNRSIFWVVADMVPFGNHKLFRYLLGWLLPPQIGFMKLTTTPGIRALTFTKQVFQDIVLPMNQLEDQINMSEPLFDIYPILVYPCRIYDHGEQRGQLRPPRKSQLVPGTSYGMFNDLGVYGVPRAVRQRKRYDAVFAMRQMERFIREVGGYPFLYADIFMTRDEFEATFDLTAYEKVRSKYYSNKAFPDLYDKVKPEIDVFEIGKAYAEPL